MSGYYVVTIAATGAAASSAAASSAAYSYNASASTCTSTSSAGSSSNRGQIRGRSRKRVQCHHRGHRYCFVRRYLFYKFGVGVASSENEDAHAARKRMRLDEYPLRQPPNRLLQLQLVLYVTVSPYEQAKTSLMWLPGLREDEAMRPLVRLVLRTGCRWQ